MADYFNEYSAFAGNRLPSPADTPYETPSYLRSKRSSRAGSSREQSATPPPLPSDPVDTQDKSRDGHFSPVDPRRFTPTLHASLVSEILNLRREIDSKNNLVENLETALAQTRDDNDSLAGKLSETSKEIRKAKHQVQQMEKGTLDAVEDLAKERDAAKSAFHEIRSKFEVTQKKTRVQDDDAVRAQSIWESEKESWDNERRQLERRVHVTESRLRAVLDEMVSQQSQAMQVDDVGDGSAFKDSGLGEGSDTASIRSAAPASPTKHRRNMSSNSFKPRNARTSVSSRGTAATPDLYSRSGNTLADELGIDEEDEYDADEYDNDEAEIDSSAGVQRMIESRQSSRNDDGIPRVNRINGIEDRASNATLTMDGSDGLLNLHSPRDFANHEQEQRLVTLAVVTPRPISHGEYVDTGYQPSPPPSPPQVVIAHHDDLADRAANAEMADDVRPAVIGPSPELLLPATGSKTRVVASPISPPETPEFDGGTWSTEKATPEVGPVYHTASTQTDLVEPRTQQGHTPRHDSLSLPITVPSIAIHPPSSRPSSPRPYALPPGTKNAASQANINSSYQDAGMQTAEIRVDKRPVKLAAHLLPSHLLPSSSLSEATSRPKRVAPAESQKTLTKPPAAISIPASASFHFPVEYSTEMSRSTKDLRSHPLKAIPLPRPVLSPLTSPALPQPETHNSNGPLNRSAQYGVSQPRLDSQPLADDVDPWSAQSDYEGQSNEFEAGFASSVPGLSRPPPGRFGLSEPPKAVPEDKEISPERRPDTAGSYGNAPRQSGSNSRPSSQSRHVRQASKSGKSDSRRDPRSRSPSFGSLASSSQSAPTAAPMPPFPIPMRRSSRAITKPHSDGSQSPLSYEFSGARSSHAGGSWGHARQSSLRKVQSAAVIRTRTGRISPKKGHRQRRRTPDLTPVQSMAFEDSPMATDFPIPELPTPLHDTLNYIQGSVDMGTSTSSAPRASEEANLVDAIAGTMVGEWMWKYIRKRKSFGIGDDADLPVGDQNGFMNSTGHGTRHKRWVWLSPYERTIMWDSKQPTSGPALLGKKGRKLAIQSVLDVPDFTAIPKNPELGSAWRRSILILTPERALKFTATTRERHKLWMAALSFLAESQSDSQLTQDANSIPRTIKAPPPDPSTSFDGVPIKRHRAPSFGKATVRDSIRIAKGKKLDHSRQYDMSYESAREDGAEFPSVPRLHITTSRHHRKRSYTNPGVQPTSDKFRSLTSSAIQSSYGGSTNGSSYRPSASSKSGSRRDSIASPDQPNFFEAVGTVRMEAFVDPNVRDGVLYVPAPPPTAGGATRRRRHERDLSQSTVDKRRAGFVFDGDDDPFHGF